MIEPDDINPQPVQTLETILRVIETLEQRVHRIERRGQQPEVMAQLGNLHRRLTAAERMTRYLGCLVAMLFANAALNLFAHLGWI